MPLSTTHRKLLIQLVNDLHNEHDRANRSLAQDPSITKTPFTNFTRNVNKPNALVINVQNERELSILTHKINQLNNHAIKHQKNRITAHVAAGGMKDTNSQSYSFTECAVADVILHLVGQQYKNADELYEKDAFHKIKIVKQVDENTSIVEVGASVMMGDLHRILYEKFNLDLPTSPLIPFVTTGGGAGTGVNGSGIHQSGFCGLINAMTICRPNGSIEKISKAHSEFGKYFDAIRAANFGAFGPVISLEIACTKAKKWHLKRTRVSIPEFFNRLEKGLFEKAEYTFVEPIITYNPKQLSDKEMKSFIIYSANTVDPKTPDKNNHATLSYLFQVLEISLEDTFNVLGFLAKHTSLITPFLEHLVAELEVCLEAADIIAPSYQLAHFKNVFTHDIVDPGFILPVKRGKDENGKYSTDFIAFYKTYLASLIEGAKANQYPLMYPQFIRSFAGTNGGLSPSRHDDQHYLLAFDAPSIASAPGFAEFKQNTIVDYCFHQLKAQPHPGKFVPDDYDYQKEYGKDFDTLLRGLKKWLHTSNTDLTHSAFMNDFARRVFNLKRDADKQKPKKTLTKPVNEPSDYAMAQKLLGIVQKGKNNGPHKQNMTSLLMDYIAKTPRLDDSHTTVADNANYFFKRGGSSVRERNTDSAQKKIAPK